MLRNSSHLGARRPITSKGLSRNKVPYEKAIAKSIPRSLSPLPPRLSQPRPLFLLDTLGVLYARLCFGWFFLWCGCVGKAFGVGFGLGVSCVRPEVTACAQLRVCAVSEFYCGICACAWVSCFTGLAHVVAS